MHRPLLVVLVLVAMLCNGVAGAAMRGWVDATGDARHATMHMMKIKHHHHVDGSYQADDSRASFAHAAADATHSTAAIPSPAVHVDLPDLGSPSPAFLGRPLPSPFVPPLRRPPRPLT